MNRSARILLSLSLTLALFAGLVGCTTPSGAPAESPSSTVPAKLRIGTLPTEDTLPLWVAERDDLFKKAGIEVEIISFASAQERDAALTANAIDGFMGDLIAAASLRAGGVPVKVATVMLGATPAEGRFGIAVKPGSKVTSLEGLADKPIGTSSGTIQEYVLDQLMIQAGVSPEQIKKEEVKKVPVRFELLMSGKLEAAALPEPFLSLAEKTGAKVVADDAGDSNLSQTVLVFAGAFLDEPAGAAAVTKLLGVWDEAVAVINKDPNAFRALLVEKARLPKPLESTYKVNTYPTAQLPKKEQVEDVLDWMKGSGLLTKEVTFRDLTWTPPAK
ncbi:MAG: MetQ/NlpA family ABC transporter substrate-binding protein [Coriobacteriia bacterium]|nr:MetQ/NlpA family ABC transporter substrate-binding protein [Coriobacteriia bacterium]